jgi:hypothetical protein
MKSQPSNLFYHILSLQGDWERELPANWKDWLECVQRIRIEVPQHVFNTIDDTDVITEEYLNLTK